MTALSHPRHNSPVLLPCTHWVDDVITRLASTRRAFMLMAFLIFGMVTAVTSPPVNAAETSAAAAAALKVLTMPLAETDAAPSQQPPPKDHASPLPHRNSITVQKGESIDAVIRRGMPGLPLKEDFMRQALANANPSIFPKGRTYPVRPGTVLTLPSHETLRQMMLSNYPDAATLFLVPANEAATPEVPPGPDKRRWVRFP